MDYGLYDAVARWAEHTGGSMDEGLAFVGFAWFIAIVVFCWAMNFAADLGYNIYTGYAGAVPCHPPARPPQKRRGAVISHGPIP